jgi:sec-independent protein translocase protein TatA
MPFRNFGPLELVLILILALIIFGPGRIARLGSELGKGIRGFKEGLQEINADEEETDEFADAQDEETTNEKA